MNINKNTDIDKKVEENKNFVYFIKQMPKWLKTMLLFLLSLSILYKVFFNDFQMLNYRYIADKYITKNNENNSSDYKISYEEFDYENTNMIFKNVYIENKHQKLGFTIKKAIVSKNENTFIEIDKMKFNKILEQYINMITLNNPYEIDNKDLFYTNFLENSNYKISLSNFNIDNKNMNKIGVDTFLQINNDSVDVEIKANIKFDLKEYFKSSFQNFNINIKTKNQEKLLKFLLLMDKRGVIYGSARKYKIKFNDVININKFKNKLNEKENIYKKEFRFHVLNSLFNKKELIINLNFDNIEVEKLYKEWGKTLIKVENNEMNVTFDENMKQSCTSPIIE